MVRSTRAVAFASLLALAAACGGGRHDPSFQEVYDLGLDQYLGRVEPSSRHTDGAFTTYDFDPEDGPRCLFGQPYRVDFRHADSPDLVMFLAGGGACWSDLCAATPFIVPGPIVSEGFALMRLDVDGAPLGARNVADLSYCDGSLFAGDADYDDDGDGAIDRYHRGLRNLSAGLDMAVREFPSPRRIVIAGASGGGYSTIVAPFLVRALWPDVPIDVINDAGVGLAKPGDPSFVNGLLDEYHITRFIPASCEDCTGNGHVTRFIDWQLAHDPRLRIAALSSYEDFVIGQIFLQIDAASFRAALTTETAWLAERHPGRYERFLYPGAGHTVILAGLDGVSVDGITSAAWLRAMLQHDAWDSLLAAQ